MLRDDTIEIAGGERAKDCGDEDKASWVFEGVDESESEETKRNLVQETF